MHRQLKKLIANPDLQDSEQHQQYLESTAEQASKTERRAEAASRDVIQWLKCEYMSDKVGEDFDAMISTVTEFGLFVELQDYYVEGLVHITALGTDYYHFDSVRRRLKGERSGREYVAGQTLRVRLGRVDMQRQRIDFDLTELVMQQKRNKKSRNRKWSAR